MNSVTAADVRAFLLERYAQAFAAGGMSDGAIPDDFDLLTEGVIDSFGILEMIGAMEERFGLELDYEQIDPQDLTVIGPLSRFIESQSGGGSGEEG